MKDATIFIAPSADVVGRVKVGSGSSIWFQAVLRGDYNEIIIGENSNIQDGTVVHVDPDISVKVGDFVTVGHNCIIHGCVIHDNTIIGMGSTVMNRAVIGENSIIGANSLVTEGTEIPPNSLAMGSPARVVRPLTADELTWIRKNAEIYIENGKKYQGKEIKLDQEGYLDLA